ncbi:MAG: mercuric transporter [Candidatus Binatia bacterium]|nr:MAG: mercuric transporter [Candidatus Binatia bacterium]
MNELEESRTKLVEQRAPSHRMRLSLGASVGSVLAAFVASACCVGPLVFALLGIGGAGLLVRFEPYRPYFIAVTLVLLGAGFYFAYGRSEPASGEGAECGCEVPEVNRAGRFLLWVATALVLAFLSFPYLAPYLLG